MSVKKPARRATRRASKPTRSNALVATRLLPELRELIQASRQTVARGVNAAITLLYWQVGQRIRKDLLKAERAEYGRQILSTLSKELVAEFGNGFSVPNLSRMLALVEAFPEQEIVATLSRQLGWSHFVELLPLDKPFQRDFYAEMCRVEGWSVRTLRDKIGGMLYERTALSKKPAKLIERELRGLRTHDTLTPDLVFKDHYVLDFLGLRDTYSEKDLEAAILREMERFLLELGGSRARWNAKNTKWNRPGEEAQPGTGSASFLNSHASQRRVSRACSTTSAIAVASS